VNGPGLQAVTVVAVPSTSHAVKILIFMLRLFQNVEWYKKNLNLNYECVLFLTDARDQALIKGAQV
jgi:hypothetical protein